MKNHRILFAIAGIAALSLAVTGCSGSGASKAPALSCTVEADAAFEPDLSGSELELLNIETPTEFSYGNAECDMIFRFKDGAWINPLATADPINQERFQAMADSFLNLKALSQVENPGDKGQYGLEDPAYSVLITDKENGETDIYIGNQDADGNYYLTVNMVGVYTVKPELVESMIFDYNSLVSRDTIDLNLTVEDIKSASFTVGGTTTNYKTSDKEKMAAIADTLSKLKPSDYASYYGTADELDSWGLTEDARAVFTAVINHEGAEGTLTLYLGVNADVEKNYRYLQIGGSKMVTIVETSLTDVLGEIPE